MADERPFLAAAIPEVLRWKAPGENMDARYDAEARRLQAEEFTSAILDAPASGGPVAFRRTPTAAELKAIDERQAERAAAMNAALDREQAAKADLDRSNAELAQLRDQVAQAEHADRERKAREKEFFAGAVAVARAALDAAKRGKKGKR